jgi:predicted Zn finger-like uncharacterized protein
MKITCQTCQSKYTVSDEKVQGKTVKIKCRKCGATILVNSSGATTSPAGAADAVSISTSAGELGVSFLVNVGEGDQRTMSLVEVVDAYNASVVTADTYVWSDGMGDWQPLGQVESIVSALNSGVAPVATPEPAAYAAPEPTPYAPQYAAAAAAPQPVAEPAPRAAARRDSGRRGPDLFGGGMGAEEVATSAPAFNGRAPSPMAASGQREENSMLFSLSALTAKAAPAAPSSSSSSSKTSASREDSGLIDLRALAESAGASGPTNLVPDNVGLFPLGAPQVAAPIAAPIMSAPSIAPPPASKAPIFIGVGIAVAALAIVGAFFAMKGGDKPLPVATETSAAAPVSAAPPVVEPPPTASAVAVAAPTASASAVAAVGKPAKGGTGKAAPAGAATAKTGGGTGAAAPAAPAVPAAPKKGNCGCAAGDLLCAMKCSAK